MINREKESLELKKWESKYGCIWETEGKKKLRIREKERGREWECIPEGCSPQKGIIVWQSEFIPESWISHKDHIFFAHNSKSRKSRDEVDLLVGSIDFFLF